MAFPMSDGFTPMLTIQLPKGVLNMTMWLLDAMIAPVIPAPGFEAGYFQLDGVPKINYTSELWEWIEEEGRECIVPGAKLVGIHDSQNLMNDDPRFNRMSTPAETPFDEDDDDSLAPEPEFAIIRKPDGTYLCAMLVNAPEMEFFRYMLRNFYGYGDGIEYQGVKGEWKQNPKKEETAFRNERDKSHHEALNNRDIWRAEREALAAAAAAEAAKPKAKAKPKANPKAKPKAKAKK